jgi:hypothetical protein
MKEESGIKQAGSWFHGSLEAGPSQKLRLVDEELFYELLQENSYSDIA